MEEKKRLSAEILQFLDKLPVGLRSRAFHYVNLQGINDEFASLGCQLHYALKEVRPELQLECDALIEQYDAFLARSVSVSLNSA
jgi:hypothetical protein